MDPTHDPHAAPSPEWQVIGSAAEYTAGIAHMIALARSELRIFDPDGHQLGLNRQDRIAALEHFVGGDPQRRVFLALQSAEHLPRDCPRFIELLRFRTEQIAVHQTEGDAARVQDCFVIADAEHCVRRPVAAQPRGVIILNDARDVALQRERFDEIWASSASAVSATTIGL